MNTCDYEYKEVRGPENQPILIVGDSPSKKVENIKEVLDRNHMIYNSIIFQSNIILKNI